MVGPFEARQNGSRVAFLILPRAVDGRTDEYEASSRGVLHLHLVKVVKRSQAAISLWIELRIDGRRCVHSESR